jgi:hypothetical protein
MRGSSEVFAFRLLRRPRGTTVVPTAASHASRELLSGDAWETGDATGRIFTVRARFESGSGHPAQRQRRTVTVTGFEAIPLATTTSRLRPSGVERGSVNFVFDLAPGAVDTELQLNVRA